MSIPDLVNVACIKDGTKGKEVLVVRGQHYDFPGWQVIPGVNIPESLESSVQVYFPGAKIDKLSFFKKYEWERKTIHLYTGVLVTNVKDSSPGARWFNVDDAFQYPHNDFFGMSIRDLRGHIKSLK
jgi:hypothetical protein